MALNIKYDVLLGALRESDMIAILSSHIFATTTERDAYFNPDALNEIVPGLEIIVGTSIFRWAGATPTTSSEYTTNLSNWVNVTSGSLTATQIKSLYESNANTNALTDPKNTVLNAFQIVGDELQVVDLDLFAREIRTNTGTLSLDDSVTIRSNSQGLDLEHNARNEFCEVIVSKYDSTGSELPQYPEKGGLITNALQALSDTTNADFNFTRQVSVKSHFMGFIVNPAAIGSGTFQVRLGTSTGAVLVTETTINFTTADTDHSFSLSNPIKVNVNDVLWVSYTGVALNGSVLSGVSGFSDGFVPVLSTSIHLETDKPLATQEYVDGRMGTASDSNAIHDNVSGEIAAIDEKTAPVDADIILIEDSEDSNNKKRVTVSNLRSQTPIHHTPSIQNLTIDIASRVDLNTDLNTSHTITFTIHNKASLSSLTLIVITGTNIDIPLSSVVDGANSVSITLAGISTTSQSTVTFQLSGTDTQGTTVTSNTITINVSNQSQHTAEVYLDTTSDNAASSVDVANAVTSDEINPTLTISTFTENSYLQILQRMSRSEFNLINIGGLNQIGAFTINDNARTINSVSYRQYVTTNMVTNSLSGDTIILGGAS